MTNAEREDLRHLALEALVVRHPAALPERAIRRAVATSAFFTVTEADLVSALQFLSDQGLVLVQVDALGSTQFYQATAAGMLAWERNQNLTKPNHD